MVCGTSEPHGAGEGGRHFQRARSNASRDRPSGERKAQGRILRRSASTKSARLEVGNRSCKSLGNWHDRSKVVQQPKGGAHDDRKILAGRRRLCRRYHRPGLKVMLVTFSPVPAKQGDGPDFVVLGNDEQNGEYEVGAAWNRQSKSGKPYLWVKLDASRRKRSPTWSISRSWAPGHGIRDRVRFPSIRFDSSRTAKRGEHLAHRALGRGRSYSDHGRARHSGDRGSFRKVGSGSRTRGRT